MSVAEIKKPRKTSLTPAEKIAQVREDLSTSLIERDAEIDAVLTALIAGESVLLVGPPGVGKSMLADGLCAALDASKFSLLLNKFTTPEEVCGPLSLQGLKEDRYERVIDGYLPTAEVAFLDEIFKASSAILNTMLRLLNERVYTIGAKTVRCPLQLCIGASNEWPGGQDGQQELGALFDRFLIRRNVKPIQDPRNLEKLCWSDDLSVSVSQKITTSDLVDAREEAANLEFSKEAKEAFRFIVGQLRTEGVSPGDRRLRKSIGIAKAFAYLNGADEVASDHLEILSDVLWDDPTEQPKIVRKVIQTVANPSGLIVNQLLSEAQEIVKKFNPRDMVAGAASTRKLVEISKKLGAIDDSNVPGSKAYKAMEYVAKQRKDLKNRMVEAMDS